MREKLKLTDSDLDWIEKMFPDDTETMAVHFQRHLALSSKWDWDVGETATLPEARRYFDGQGIPPVPLRIIVARSCAHRLSADGEYQPAIALQH